MGSSVPGVPERAHPLRASPLVGSVVVQERMPGRLVASWTVDPAEPVLSGHFPGFAILPGVCLVECAHQAALLALTADEPAHRPVLAAVERARFLAPVFPGDEVFVDVTSTPTGGGWRCPVRLTVRRPGGDRPEHEAAVVRLRYRTGKPAGADR